MSLSGPSPAVTGEGVSRVSRFPCKEFPRMLRVSDSAASVSGLRLSVAHGVAFPLIRTRSARR